VTREGPGRPEKGQSPSPLEDIGTADGRRGVPIAWTPVPVAVSALELPLVVDVAAGSAAQRVGLQRGDEILRVNGAVPRDVIEWRLAVDDAEVELEIRRGGLDMLIEIEKRAGEPLGAEVSSAVFDRVRTCDNHCEFCFIYQLPPGLRQSLYLKDDDYRLSFLYGNFTTLTRFTEADLERVVTERLSPLNVSIHATDPVVRERMLRNKRGGMSLRWLRALLDHDITVNGQIVVCPGVNDAAVLESTLVGILDRFPELAHVAVVPLGLSRFNTEAAMRLHTRDEAQAVVDLVDEWQQIYLSVLGRRLVYAADEYYLMAGRDFPDPATYGDFSMHEDGIGMARTFELELMGQRERPVGPQSGFFSWVDGAPAAGYRAPRNPAGDTGLRGCGGSDGDNATSPVSLRPRTPDAHAPIGILTGVYGAQVLEPLVTELCRTHGRHDVRIISVENRFFGGNTAVTGLMVGDDLVRVLADEPSGHRYLLPDVCLSEGRFLDGLTPADLPRAVDVIPTDGIALRHALIGQTS
jgi:putative radical SAM enzyme (TIGR03279 family)